VVDGVDELEPEQQAEVLSYLTTLTNTNRAELGCKVLIASRDTGLIAERIGSCQTIHLKSETSALQSAIQAYVRHELSILRSIFGNLDAGDALEELERELIDKADGKPSIYAAYHLLSAIQACSCGCGWFRRHSDERLP
jgi:hypothetical protein